MKSIFISQILICALAFQLSAQEGSFGPLNPEYVRYVDEIKTHPASNLSVIPPFFKSGVVLKNNERTANKLKSTELAFPAKFDLRDSGWVTPVKNQVKSGPCWAFASIASLESNWLLNGYGTFDLSEQNMATCNNINSNFFSGGTAYMASAYLTRLKGPLLEKDDTFNLKSPYCSATNKPIVKYVLSSMFLPNDKDVIKQSIMKYGSVAVSMHFLNETEFFNSNVDINSYSLYSENYNKNDFTFCYSGTKLFADHMVTVVGWDDNKVITGGTKSIMDTKGAWIVKNTFGENWGDKGYFYVSYFDKCFLMDAILFDKTVETKEIDTMYFYDENSVSGSYGYNNTIAWGLTKFFAPHKERVKMVGTFILVPGTKIDISIYKSFTNGTLNNKIYSQEGIYCNYNGHRVFDVDAEVEGEYYVVIKYTNPFYGYPMPIETRLFASNVIQAPGYNWVSPDGINWQQVGKGISKKELDLTIRSYNIKTEKAHPTFILPSQDLCIYDSLLLKTDFPGDIIACKWLLPSDAIPNQFDGPGPFYVKFSTPGTKKLKLIAGNDTTIKTIEVSRTVQVDLIRQFDTCDYWNSYFKNNPVKVGNSVHVFVYTSADSLKWSSEAEYSSQVQNLTVSQEGVNKFWVTAYQSGCQSTDTLSIVGVISPVNDNARDAIELKEGRNGVFTNVSATVEEKEPLPPLAECNTQKAWCTEFGLQNSVWFWFSAPESGIVSFTADGFDSQIAIYRAKTADSLFLNNYKLLAANDDYIIALPAIYNLKGLKPNEKYYLQFDGSYIGATGQFNIYYIKDKLDLQFDKDTIFLDSAEGSCDSLKINSNTHWSAKEYSNWFELGPGEGDKTGTIIVKSTTANTGTTDRKSRIKLGLYDMLIKYIPVIQKPQASQIAGNFEGINLISPNPAKDILCVTGNERWNNAIATIYDVTGRPLVRHKLAQSNKINIADLRPGLYLIEIRKNTELLGIQKFVKE